MQRKHDQSTTARRANASAGGEDLGARLRVAVGMSGGVDSSVAAMLLDQQGYDVTGVFLECWKAPSCRAEQDRKDALQVALGLKIPFKVLDFKTEYKERVVEYFFAEYAAGRTPNPDTKCNREIKFGLFYEWAMKQGFDYIATGHYARVVEAAQASSSMKYLVRGVDQGKDQSYFLYQLRQEQLEHVLFPIGGMKKSEVRAEAGKRGLRVAGKPDSTGICFIGPVDVREFLKERIREKPGKVLWREHEVGRHVGVAFYTLGQRVGGVVDKRMLKKLYQEGVFEFNPASLPGMFVVEKDVEQNVLVVGTEDELWVNDFEVGEVHWVDPSHKLRIFNRENVYVRIRNLGQIVGARITKQESRITVELDEPLRGVAAGQACVFYSDDSVDAVVLGGGVIG